MEVASWLGSWDRVSGSISNYGVLHYGYTALFQSFCPKVFVLDLVPRVHEVAGVARATERRGVNIMRINTKYRNNAYYPKYC